MASTITRTQNTNGTYRFTLEDGTVLAKGTTKAYTHAAAYTLTDGSGVTYTLHTREDLAVKGKPNSSAATRIPGVIVIDVVEAQVEQAPEVEPIVTPEPKAKKVPTATKPTTCQIQNVPVGQVIRIHAVNGTTLDKPVRGSVHKVAAGLWMARYGKVATEFTPAIKVTYHIDLEADSCKEHNDPLRQRPGGAIRCRVCVADYSKGRRADGGVTHAAKRAQAKAERLERVVMAALVKEERSREQMIGNAVLRASQGLAVQKMRGSEAKRDGYRRAHLTAMAAGFGVSIEDAANWAGIPTWEPMTWSAYRKEFAKDTTDVAAA